MPSRAPAPAPPLTVAVVAALWLSLGRCGVPEPPGPRCDSGKLWLDRDLPADAVYWDCPVSTWPDSTQRHPSIDTAYEPEPAGQICMDEAISYNQTIPNSGVYRPVRAEHGEYLYCPPQRWLNNLHHGATVLLYHPCTRLHERLLLSGLARSCLSDYIITPHPQLNRHTPIALVSWGRTLELSTVASPDICDGLEATNIARNKPSGENHQRKYDLLLTRPAKQHRQNQHQEEHSTNTKESLRQCCELFISPLLNEAPEAELESHTEKEDLKIIEKKRKSRQIRAAIREKHKTVQNESNTTPASTSLTDQTTRPTVSVTAGTKDYNPAHSAPGPSAKEDPSQAEIHNRSQSLAPGPTASSLGFEQTPIQAATPLLSPKYTDHENTNPSAVSGEHNHTTPTLEASVLSPKHQGTESTKRGVEEKKYDKVFAANGKMKDNDVVDVKERELEHMETHSHHKNENNGFDSGSKSQSESVAHPQQRPNSQPDIYLPDSRDCDSCRADERCDCAEASGAAAQAAAANTGLPRTPRTDEAVWAAAALGFLLVLLTLSVLHTRLYRHWRTTPSLYWHDPRQDYDSVADVIRRRLQIAKRRRKRGRRQECVLLPSSSSSDYD